MKTNRILIFLLFMGIAFSCEKEYYTSIPNYPVNIELRLENMDYELNAKLAYKTIIQPRYAVEKTGYGGILVINGMGENPVNLFAYDLACPVEVQRNVRVVPDHSGITATCPQCGAVFTIATGIGRPESGTKYSLKSYRVVGNGAQYIVTN